MHTRVKQILVVAALAVMTAVPPAMSADSVASENQLPAERQGGDMAFDLVVARPLGLLSIVGGVAAFVISLPFTIPSGSVDSAAEELVKKPITYTFKRPLGQVQE